MDTDIDFIAAAKAIPSQTGLLALFNLDPEWARSALGTHEAREYSIRATEYGVNILFTKAEIQVPIPIVLLNYLLEVPDIVLMFAKPEDYIPTPLFTVTVDKEIIRHAKEILQG